jgi:hypothetical protein
LPEVRQRLPVTQLVGTQLQHRLAARLRPELLTPLNPLVDLLYKELALVWKTEAGRTMVTACPEGLLVYGNLALAPWLPAGWALRTFPAGYTRRHLDRWPAVQVLDWAGTGLQGARRSNTHASGVE